MNITFMIGNGFDVSLGMESSYNSFYMYLQENDLLQDNIFTKIINKDIKKWSDFERMLGILTTYSDNQETIESNLKKLAFDISDSESQEIIGMIIDEKELPEKFVEDLDVFQDEFRCYLEEKQKSVLEKLSTEADCSGTIAETLNGMYADFHGFEEDYFVSNIRTKIGRDFQERYFLNVDINFLNFNYTDTVSYLINNTAKKSISDFFQQLIASKRINDNNNVNVMVNIKEEHIHATLRDGMYLGIDSDKQCIDDFFSDPSDMEELIKPTTKDYFNDDSVKAANDVILSTDLLVVFGMSFGETDQIYWDMIRNKFYQEPNTFQFVINVYDENYPADFILVGNRSYRRNQNKLKNAFFERIKFQTDRHEKSAIRRTHPILNSRKMFRFRRKE